MNTITLNDGNTIPAVGYGVFLIPAGDEAYHAVLEALKTGYRHIDTAAAYYNEADVGKAVKDSGIPREDIFITSKLWLQDYGYEAAKKGIETSMKNLGVDYIDLYLLHQPYGDVCGAFFYKNPIVRSEIDAAMEQQAGMVDPRRNIISQAMETEMYLLQQQIQKLKSENENLKKENQKLKKALSKRELNLIKQL